MPTGVNVIRSCPAVGRSLGWTGAGSIIARPRGSPSADGRRRRCAALRMGQSGPGERRSIAAAGTPDQMSLREHSKVLQARRWLAERPDVEARRGADVGDKGHHPLSRSSAGRTGPEAPVHCLELRLDDHSEPTRMPALASATPAAPYRPGTGRAAVEADPVDPSASPSMSTESAISAADGSTMPAPNSSRRTSCPIRRIIRRRLWTRRSPSRSTLEPACRGSNRRSFRGVRRPAFGHRRLDLGRLGLDQPDDMVDHVRVAGHGGR